MNDLFILIADYIKGKSIYTPIRRLANLIFNLSITTEIYEAIYGKFDIDNVLSIHGVFDFLLHGYFFIPFSILIIVWITTEFIGMGIFKWITHRKWKKTMREIMNYQYQREEVEEKINLVSETSTLVVPVQITYDMMLSIYNEFKSKINQKLIEEIEDSLKQPKHNVELNFVFVFRTMCATLIYFITLPLFGWKLFLTVFIVLLLIGYLLIIAYRLMDLVPTLISKFHSIAEKYIAERVEKSKS